MLALSTIYQWAATVVMETRERVSRQNPLEHSLNPYTCHSPTEGYRT